MSLIAKKILSNPMRMKVALFALAILSLLWGFKELLLHHAPSMFRAVEEDLSYAWYVPIFSLYVLWTERQRIVGSLASPSVLGIILSLPFFALGFIGVRGVQIRFEIVAFAGLLITLPWAFWGRETAKRMLFPAGFLLFCIPMASFLDIVTVHLRLLSTSVAYGALKGFGADIVRNGTAIAAADGSFSIDVADPCSGLRSLFALMALSAAYAYFNQKTWVRRGLLFALSVPIAIAGNVPGGQLLHQGRALGNIADLGGSGLLTIQKKFTAIRGLDACENTQERRFTCAVAAQNANAVAAIGF